MPPKTQKAVVDKAARGGETVLKHLEYGKILLFYVYSVIKPWIYRCVWGVFPSKQREK